MLQDLKQLPQWVGHKDKIPKNPNTGHNASSTNPETWANAAQAWRAKQRNGWDGIGFVFTIESGIVGVDLDDCFHYPEDDGIKRLKPWARDVVQCLNSYTELSPSGNGLHILCIGEIPYSITKNKIGFEMYNEARYFTVTGREYGAGTGCYEIAERQKELTALHVTFADDPINKPLPKVQGQNEAISKIEVEKALAVLPVHQDYNDWLRCLMAVHDAFPDSDGVAMIEAWSPGHRGEVANKFRSFDRTAKDGVTIASLFHLAKRHGYQPPMQPKPTINGKMRRGHVDKTRRLMAV